jgi:hypothetical protein
MRARVAAAVAAGLLAGAARPAAGQFVVAGGYGYHSHASFGYGHTRFGFSAGFSAVSVAPVYPVFPYWGGYGWPGYAVAPVLAVPYAVPVPLDGWDVPADPPRRPRRDDNFLVVRPKKADAAPAVPAARPPLPAPAGVAAGGPLAVPQAEAARQIALARAAFAADQYGRAAERLQAAIDADSTGPLAYFLLAQVRTARGEYAEAVAAVRDGMRHAPDWPDSGFRPAELYAGRADRLDAHLAELRAAVAAAPDDPTVGFLLGYHLWFLGRRDEAARLFRRVLPAVRDAGVVGRFLQSFDVKVVRG